MNDILESEQRPEPLDFADNRPAWDCTGKAVAIAIFAGLAIGLLVRALRPEPTPRQRVMQVIEDLEEQLRDRSKPMLRKASSLAKEGTSLFHDGMECGSARLDRLVKDIRRLARNLSS